MKLQLSDTNHLKVATMTKFTLKLYDLEDQSQTLKPRNLKQNTFQDSVAAFTQLSFDVALGYGH